MQCIHSGLSVVFRGYLAVATPQLLTVDSGTTTPAIDAIPQPAFAGAAVTVSQSSSAGDDDLELI